MNTGVRKKGIIIYEKEVAKQRSWYIDKYYQAFKRLGIQLELIAAEEIEEQLKELAGSIDFAIVRVISPSLSRELESSGIRVFNSAHVSEIANDKLECYRYIEKNTEVPFMPMCQASLDGELPKFPFIAKSRAGHGGTEVFYISSYDELVDMFSDKDAADYIFQQVCSTPGVDVRVYVIGGKIVTAMKRMNAAFGDESIPEKERYLSNYCISKRASVYEIDEIMKGYVEAIVKVLKLDFAGIDFIFDDNKPIFNEIEDVVGARMVYDLTDIDIVELYAEYISRCMR